MKWNTTYSIKMCKALLKTLKGFGPSKQNKKGSLQLSKYTPLLGFKNTIFRVVYWLG